jgi:hypothetical protein
MKGSLIMVIGFFLLEPLSVARPQMKQRNVE